MSLFAQLFALLNHAFALLTLHSPLTTLISLTEEKQNNAVARGHLISGFYREF